MHALDRPAGPFSTIARTVGTVLSPLTGWIRARLQTLIRRRLHGYRVRVNTPDTLRPTQVDGKVKVAVVGGGLAGAAAARTLAARGFGVTLYEREPQLGGKLSAWNVEGPDGDTLEVEHGFHAFFGCYHNLMDYLDELGVTESFETTPDYRILTASGDEMRFEAVDTTPFLNLFDLVWSGVFSARKMFLNPAMRNMDPLLRYDPVTTPAELDDTSYAEFADRANLPDDMRLMFNSFTRAFFARGDQMSMAELIRSFHMYYLGSDAGLLFSYPTDDHRRSLWAPIRADLEAHGVLVHTDHPIDDITRQKNGRLRLANRPFDHVVLAVDTPAARRILGASDLVPSEDPRLLDRIDRVMSVNRYAVLRLWLDRDIREGLPAFTVTEKIRALDSITTVHRYQDGARAWTDEHGGSILELHAYEVPEALQTPEAIREALWADALHYLPELDGAGVHAEDLQVKKDFATFHTGMHRYRPRTTTHVDGLLLAGDWVRTDLPAMLMEGAFTSGMLAANEILKAHGVQQDPVYSVPLRSMLAKGPA